ncbi:transposase [Streptomyces sp. NPDC001868]|uniref:transposase n=1 Tax=Streptomyces sp. NPDC001868 TaxID=3154401 RepID=UPI0033239CF6
MIRRPEPAVASAMRFRSFKVLRRQDGQDDAAHLLADILSPRKITSWVMPVEWIRQAEQDAPKPMQGFAGSLRQDLDAVTAGLTLPWSSGVVEGHVNRSKLSRGQMYGRASFTFLRTRILTRA